MSDAVEKAVGRRVPLVWVAELFSVLTAGAFLASIWMHQTVFSSWGLSYFQVATPADVLMGGISTLALGLGLVPWFMAGVAVAAALYWLTRFLPVSRRWLDWPIAAASLLVAWAVVRNGITATFDAAQFVLLAYGAAATWLVLRLKPSLSPARYRTAVFAAAILAVVVALAYSCGQRITFGFGGDPDFAGPLPVSYDLRARCEHERVVWIGQRALVVRCEGLALDQDGKDLDFKKLHLVLLNPDALWLGNRGDLLGYDRGTRAYEARETARKAARGAPEPSVAPAK